MNESTVNESTEVRRFCEWVRSRAVCLEDHEVVALLAHEFDVDAGPEFERPDVQAMWEAWEASATTNRRARA